MDNKASIEPHHLVHSTSFEADADAVFETLADVSKWPVVFGPTIHVEVDGKHSAQLMRIWATANSGIANWRSIRDVDAAAKTINFRQTVSPDPLQWMTGRWNVRQDGATCTVELHHAFETVSGSAKDNDYVIQAVDTNSDRELEALRTALSADSGALYYEFVEQRWVDARTAEGLLDFIWDGEKWPSRIPHVAEATVTPSSTDAHWLEMHTEAADGSTHRTRSARVFADPSTIAYKQSVTPSSIIAHAGRWTVEPHSSNEVRFSSWHGLLLDRASCRRLLSSPEATDSEIRAAVRKNIGGNSLKTMELAVSSSRPVR